MGNEDRLNDRAGGRHGEGLAWYLQLALDLRGYVRGAGLPADEAIREDSRIAHRWTKTSSGNRFEERALYHPVVAQHEIYVGIQDVRQRAVLYIGRRRIRVQQVDTGRRPIRVQQVDLGVPVGAKVLDANAVYVHGSDG